MNVKKEAMMPGFDLSSYSFSLSYNKIYEYFLEKEVYSNDLLYILRVPSQLLAICFPIIYSFGHILIELDPTLDQDAWALSATHYRGDSEKYEIYSSGA